MCANNQFITIIQLSNQIKKITLDSRCLNKIRIPLFLLMFFWSLPGSAAAEPSDLQIDGMKMARGDCTLCTCVAMSSFWMMMSSLSKLLLFSRNVCGLHSLLPRLFKYSFVTDGKEVIVRDRQMNVSFSYTYKYWLTDRYRRSWALTRNT